VAADAALPGHAVCVRAPYDWWSVAVHVHHLRGCVAARMAVGAAGMQENTACFEKQRTRTLAAVGDRREPGDVAKRPRVRWRRLLLRRSRFPRGTCRDQQQRENSYRVKCADHGSVLRRMVRLTSPQRRGTARP